MPRDRGRTWKAWGRRPYADKESREILNDISRQIRAEEPEHVDDPSDPTLSEVLKTVYDPDTKATTLSDLMSHGLSFEEAVCWYWFRHCQFDLMNIHYAIRGIKKGGDPAHRRNSVRNIQRVLESAAFKVPGEDPADIPNLDEVLSEHDEAAEAQIQA